jgi:hypothetical protein
MKVYAVMMSWTAPGSNVKSLHATEALAETAAKRLRAEHRAEFPGRQPFYWYDVKAWDVEEEPS